MVFTLIFATTLLGCIKGENYDIKSAKVKNPEEVSNSCSQNMGLNPGKKEQLANVLKNNGGELNDAFKLDVYIIVSEAEEIPPQDKEETMRSYFNCLKDSAESK